MLRNIGIRSKILAVLALPVLALLVAATIFSVGAVNDARRAAQIDELASNAASFNQLARGLQAERSLTMAVLAGDESARPQLEEVRGQVSAGIEGLREMLAGIDVDILDESAAQTFAASAAAHEELDAVRRKVDTGAVSAETVFADYTDIIAAEAAIAAGVAEAVDDEQLATGMRAYTAAERVVDLVAVERDLVTPAVAVGAISPELKSKVTGLAAQREVARAEAEELAARVGVRLPVVGYSLQVAQSRVVTDPDGVLQGLTVEQWRAAADATIADLSQAEMAIAEVVAKRASEVAAEARAWAVQVGVATALFVVVPVVLALLIARGITRPLRRLTDAAAEIRRELPAMVEQMHTPGEVPTLALPEIPDTSKDEVGRLAAAFNDVNRTTVQVAQEQAALRGSIAAMFVNVARRDQVLLSRQLAFIDQLERTEENPKTLENLFRLDHLATRMRRNAESLLVLAGIDTGRRLRRPIPLSDVVRTATSEIEHYERVDLVLQTDPPMVGHVALTTAHLLAELLENATNFSDPGSRVVVSTAPGPKGVVVTITDDGLGMSADEIAEANARIAEPPVAEVVGAQRLGFFVVGRLARRLDASVTLEAGRAKGTVVRIELPPALFVPGAVVELPAPDTADDTGEVPAVLPADDAPAAELPAPAAVTPPAPAPPVAPAARTEAGLPRRGSTPPRVTPPAPAGHPAVEAAVEAPAESPAADPALAPVADEAPRRSGLFTSFRARRPDEARPQESEPAVPELPDAVESAEPVADEPVAVEPVAAEPEPAPVPEPATAPESASELSALAAPPPPQPAVTPEPVVGHTAAAALDILPSRSTLRKASKATSGRRMFGRKRHEPEAPAPVRPMSRRELRDLEAETAPFVPALTPARPASGSPAPTAPVPVEASPVPVEPPPAVAPGESGPLPARPAPLAQDAPEAGGLFGIPLQSGPAATPPAPATAPVVPAAPADPPAPVEPPAPVAAVAGPDGIADVLRQRSALASEALTELSRLSAYSPAAVDSQPPATLTRRTPAATPAAQVATARPAAAPRRSRNAADVRSMLSGFQAGVTRGRTSPDPSSAQALPDLSDLPDTTTTPPTGGPA